MPNKFNPLKTRFRATFAGNQLGANRLGKIDTENEVLHDVQITLEGEAKGHGVWLDREFCTAVAEQGNATGDVGLKVRYGHPAMCSDALGTELGRAKNFRVVDFERTLEDGTRVTAAGVVADVHLLKSAHDAPQGDIAKHVLSVAAEDPTQFGQSIVFTYADFKFIDENGEPVLCSQCASSEEFFDRAGDRKIFAVLGKLHGTDFTDTPAATDGIFSTNTLAEEAEMMLDEHPQILEVFEKSPKSVVEFLERTGLDKKLESARVAGLQAAKDKEIAELKSELADAEDREKKLSESCASELAAKDKEIAALKAENEKFQSDIAKTTEALAAAKCETVEQLCTRLGETEEALSKEKAAHQVDIERYREQVGAALAQPGCNGGAKKAKSFGERIAEGVKVVEG